MFRLLSDVNDPQSYVFKETLKDVFDVRSTVVPDYNPTMLQWMNILKALYARNSIIQHPHCFFSEHFVESRSRGVSREELVANTIIKIPDDQLWLLNFICFDGYSSMHDLLTYWYRNQMRPILDVSGFNVYSNTTDLIRLDSFSTELGEVALKSVLTRIETEYKSIMDLNPGIRLINNSMGAGTPLFINYFSNYYFNEPFILNSNDIPFNTRQMKRLLVDNPDFEIKVEGPEKAFSISVRQPITKAFRRPLYKMLSYSTSPLSMLEWPIISKGEVKPLLYGVELEMATAYTVQTLVDSADDVFFIIKQDSSVNGDKKNRYELVTIPMSLKAHRKQWAHWFSNLDYNEFDTSKDTNNGMHVHIGRDAFDTNHLKRFMWFFTNPTHSEFTEMMSQRDRQSFSDYSSLPNIRSKSKVKAFKSIRETNADGNRGCIHESNKNTIEVRLFRGIVSLAEVMKNLEFVDSVYNFTMPSRLFTKLSLKDYFKYLKSTPVNKYTVIKKYFDKTEDLNKQLDIADLQDLIFGEKEPKKILERIQKSSIKITNAHVTALNKKWKKRVFVLDKGTGEIKLDTSHQSSIAFMDRLLEQRILQKKSNAPPPIPVEQSPEQSPPRAGLLSLHPLEELLSSLR